jgi:hypothetical protein
MDRSAFSVVSLDTASDEVTYWLTQSPQARLRHMQRLRQINYGFSASERLQRVLEVAELDDLEMFTVRGIDMMTDTEIKTEGMQVLTQHLGLVEAARFIALIQRERFDYTEWRLGMSDDLDPEEISRRAMALKAKRGVK